MSLLLYNLFQWLYAAFARLYASSNEKARKWVDGRKDWENHVSNTLKPGEKRIWVHCSSVGEFEQAKPVMEALKQQYPAYKIVVTFFSPSGYEASNKNSLADYIFYLPVDTKKNAAQFIDAMQPSLVIFIKYEFWYYYLHELKRKNIPTLLVSGAFREGQAFFKWYGGFFRKMLHNFSWFFLQDEKSKQLLSTIGVTDNVVISGDTRYDRVAAIADNIATIPTVEKYKGTHKIFIAGSTWPGDEQVIKECMSVLPDDWKLIIAPHEVDTAHVQQVQQLFGDEAILYSELNTERNGADKKILIINNIGMLSRLFAYGDVAFIGGGFQKGGIHNILEPAVFGLPVIFGPVYEKFVEAKALADLNYVFPVQNEGECKKILKKLISDDIYRKSVSDLLKKFMIEHKGATGTVMNEIRRFQWLN